MKNSLTTRLYAVFVLFFAFASMSFADTGFLQKEINCLAQNIYFEANSEPEAGKVAVAQVTVNRANHPNYPNTICKVVHQKSKVANAVVCQFSWACSKKVNSKMNAADYLVAQQIAEQVLTDNRRNPVLSSALFFHSVTVSPKWKLSRVATIGNHVFYKYRN
jgi:spore germination cell wall hydrolase CwlJ-like protein